MIVNYCNFSSSFFFTVGFTSSIVFRCFDNSPMTSVILISGFENTFERIESACIEDLPVASFLCNCFSLIYTHNNFNAFPLVVVSSPIAACRASETRTGLWTRAIAVVVVAERMWRRMEEDSGFRAHSVFSPFRSLSSFGHRFPLYALLLCFLLRIFLFFKIQTFKTVVYNRRR